MSFSKLTNQSIEDRIGQRVAARLNESTRELPHDISERLRVARQQAIARRSVSLVETVVLTEHAGSTMVLKRGGLRWQLFGSIVPLIMLIVGLFAINIIQDERRASELAEVDAELLTDDLPPVAYTDPGFTQFLRQERP